MAIKISDQIADCVERARMSHERAEKEADAVLKADFLEIERHWLRLAESYRTVERLDALMSNAKLSLHMDQPSDADIEHLAERIVGRSPH